MAENQNSSVGNHLADLYNQIHADQQEVEAAKEKVKEAEAKLEKTKGSFANYLKQSGIDKLLAPAHQTELHDSISNSAKASSGQKAERKPRTSSADKASEVERNKAIYTGSYPNGVNEKTGLPIKFKGRGSANEAIAAQMADDERDYEAKQNGNTNEPVTAQEPATPAAKATKKK